jgi:septal ring factor EnvC (AmiA/AmiB activator)
MVTSRLLAALFLFFLAPPSHSAVKKAPSKPASVDSSLRQARKAADEKRRTAERLRAEVRVKERQEERTLAELERRDRELAVRRVELKRYQDEIAMMQAQATATQHQKKLTGESLAASLARLRNDLREWYQDDRSTPTAEAALWCGNGEAERISLARMSRYDLQQRESRQAEYLDHLNRLKRTLAVKERELAVKRRERADFLSRVRLEKGQTESRLKEVTEATERLDSLVTDLVRRAQRAREIASVQSRTPVPAGKLVWPMKGSILQKFGKHRHKIYNATVYSSGIEIGAKLGTPVTAAGVGTVAFSDWMQGYGRVLILDHGNGIHTVYGHLQDVMVSVAQRVGQGAVVGTAGDTGTLGVPSLYFEIRSRGRAVDPERYLAGRSR